MQTSKIEKFIEIFVKKNVPYVEIRSILIRDILKTSKETSIYFPLKTLFCEELNGFIGRIFVKKEGFFEFLYAEVYKKVVGSEKDFVEVNLDSEVSTATLFTIIKYIGNNILSLRESAEVNIADFKNLKAFMVYKSAESMYRNTLINLITKLIVDSDYPYEQNNLCVNVNKTTYHLIVNKRYRNNSERITIKREDSVYGDIIGIYDLDFLHLLEHSLKKFLKDYKTQG